MKKIALLIFSLCCVLSQTRAQSRAQEMYRSNTDWAFEENKGQFVSDMPRDHPLYAGHQSNVSIYCYADKIRLQFISHQKTQDKTKMKYIVSEAVMQLVQANLHPEIIKEEKTGERHHYYTKEFPDGLMDVPSYEKITYRSVWKNIDLVLESKSAGMEYSFVVHAGGKVSDIKISWTGQDNITKNKEGELEYSLSGRKMTETAPYSYDATGKAVGSKTNLSGNRLSFTVAEYDKNTDLTIDPSLNWATYFGGEGYDEFSTMTSDTIGDVYIGGTTTSKTHIYSKGAYDTVSISGFFAKFNSKGQRIWSSYYLGTVNSMYINKNQNLLLTGKVFSKAGAVSSFTTPGAYKRTLISSGIDAYISKFDTSGKRIWSTFIGGDDDDVGYCITSDSKNDITVVGTTKSTTGFSTTGSWSSKRGLTSGPGFLTKFSTSGKRIWSTYLGNNFFTSIHTDTSNNIIFSGSTYDSTGIGTKGTYKPKFSGAIYNRQDVYVLKFSPSGQRSWGTFYGALKTDNVGVSAVDQSNNIYLAGYTDNTDSIATSGSYRSTGIGGSAFLVKFDSSGRRKWGEFYGVGKTAIESIEISQYGTILIAGNTRSMSGIATKDGYSITNKGYSQAFLATFDTSGNQLYGTYYGGTKANLVRVPGITSTPDGSIYIGGRSDDTTLPITSGAFQSKNYGGGNDGFIVKFSCPRPQITGQRLLCAINTATYRAVKHPGVKYQWRAIGGTILSATSTADSVQVSWSSSAPDTRLRLIEQSACLDSGELRITLSPNPKPRILGDTVLCFAAGGIAATLYNPDTAGRKWNWISAKGKITSGQRSDTVYLRYNTAGRDTVRAYEVNQAGCQDSVLRVIDVRAVPIISWRMALDTMGQKVNFSPSDTMFSNYAWNFGDGNTSSLIKPGHHYSTSDTFRVSLRVFDAYLCTAKHDSDIVVPRFLGVNAGRIATADFRLWPNPCTDQLRLSYTIPHAGRVGIMLYDLSGRSIALLREAQQSAGIYTQDLSLSGQNIPAGTYIIRLYLNGELLISRELSKVR